MWPYFSTISGGTIAIIAVIVVIAVAAVAGIAISKKKKK